jgi:hypothetical protein
MLESSQHRTTELGENDDFGGMKLEYFLSHLTHYLVTVLPRTSFDLATTLTLSTIHISGNI